MPAARWGNFTHQPRAFIAGLESHAKNIGGDVARPPPPVASGDPGMLGGASRRERARAPVDGDPHSAKRPADSRRRQSPVLTKGALREIRKRGARMFSSAKCLSGNYRIDL